MNQWMYLAAILARGATQAWKEYQRSQRSSRLPRSSSWPHPSLLLPPPHPTPANSPEVQARIDEIVRAANAACERTVDRQAGVQMQIEEMQATAAGLCPVCGDIVATVEHRCPDCATLHHGDCWSWAGGCAMYGCRGRRE